MSILSNKRIRIAADAAILDAPQDELTQLRPSFYSGNDLQVEFAIFNDGELMDISNIASVTLEIKAMEDEVTPPEASDTVLMTKTIGNADLNASLSTTQWDDQSAQHGIIEFGATESNIAAGINWMSLWVLTTDDPAKIITVAAGPIRVAQDGASGSAQTPPDLSQSYYTTEQSDARYNQRSANLGDLANASAARLNLGLGSAALLNSGTSTGNVPVLDSNGLIDETLLPTQNTSTTRGGIILDGGYISMPDMVPGRGEFEWVMKIQRSRLGTAEYLVGSQGNGLSIRIDSTDKLRVGVAGVADILSSSGTLDHTDPVWVRVGRRNAQTYIVFDTQLQATLADTLPYNAAADTLMAQNSNGDSPFHGTLHAFYLFNRGLTDEEANELIESGVVPLSERWGSMTNIYDASELRVGKRVYLKTDGTESIVINGQTYADGSAESIDATDGVVITVASASITNNLTSASTLCYAGALMALDLGVGCGYALPDRSDNARHALLSANGTTHAQPKSDWELDVTVSAQGYIGGSARAVLPQGALIERIVSVGGSGAVIGIGEDDTAANIVATHTTTTGAAAATLGDIESQSGTLYVSYISGSGDVRLKISGRK